MRAILLTGVSGVGKSTMAQAVGSLWSGRGHRTAVIDTDWLAQFGPKPRSTGEHDLSFHDRLKVTNLGAVWKTFRAAGAEFAVVSASLRSTTMADAVVSVLAAPTTVIELIADVETVVSRRTARNGQPSEHPESHGTICPVTSDSVVREAAELAALGLTAERVRNDSPTEEVARMIVTAAGWA